MRCAEYERPISRHGAWPEWHHRLIGIGLAALALGCGGSSPGLLNGTADDGPVEVPPWACVPGETQPCDCPSELGGIRTCDPEGSAFGACDCSPSAVSQGPPPTSTGSDSDTGSGTDTGQTTASDTTGTGPGNTSDPDPSTSEGGSTGGPATGGPATGSSSSGPSGGESSSSSGSTG